MAEQPKKLTKAQKQAAIQKRKRADAKAADLMYGSKRKGK